MLLNGKVNEKENDRVKAFINLEIDGFQLRGFKLCENEEGQLKLFRPSMMVKDKEGNVLKDDNDKIINSQPIVLNPELTGKKEMWEKLESEVINAYKSNNNGIISKEVNIPELEKGEINVSSFVIGSTKGQTTNENIQLKSSNSLYIGAFKINGVNLFYNSQKNDFTISLPHYGTAENQFSFLVPKSSADHSRLQNAVVQSYKTKVNEFKEQAKNNKLKEQANQKVYGSEEQAATQAPVMKQ